MEIEIYKNDKEKICFKIEKEEEREFNYDNFDYLIELLYDNDKKIKYTCDEELDEYKKLLDGIIKGSRENDYRTAITAAKECEAKLEDDEKKDLAD